MAQAFGRIKGTEEWKPITWSGFPYHNTREFLSPRVYAMTAIFSHIEYKIELDEGEE